MENETTERVTMSSKILEVKKQIVGVPRFPR